MSASVEGGSNQDIDLNLAPIIDCFTVLITYLLVTASFLTLSAVDVSASASGTATPPTTPDNTPPPLVMSIELKAGGQADIEIRGGKDGKRINYSIPPGTNSWDLPSLTNRLQLIQQKFPTLSEVNVTADPTVIYKDIVRLLHEIKNVMPKVYISG